MANKRLLIVGPVFPYRGAISYCTTELARVLGNEFDVEILSFSRQYPQALYPGGSDRDPTVAHLTPAGSRFALDILNPVSWIREGLRVRRHPPDVVILVWWAWVWAIGYLVFLRCASVGRGAATPLLLQCHNVSDKEQSWWKSRLSNAIFRRAAALVVHSRTGEEELAERIGESIRPRIVRLFLPVLRIGREIPSRAEARRRLGLTGNVALFFGHIRPFKGIDVAFEAWRLLTSDATLLVAGEVWWQKEEDVQAEAARLGIERRVSFHFGFIPDDRVADYFAAADVVIAPYRHEAQSGVAMNAFHFGRPVIASAVGGIPEVVHDGENGFLVPPENAGALAQAIDRFFALPDRAAFETAAKATGDYFSWERYGSEVAAALRRL